MTTRSKDPIDHDPTTGAADAGTPGVPAVEETHAGAPAAAPEDRVSGRGRGSDTIPDTGGGKLGSAWFGLGLGALVTILLLVFVLQNNQSADVYFLPWSFTMPLGVLILLSAIAGALIMAMFAGFRILQLRMRAHKARKLATRGRAGS